MLDSTQTGVLVEASINRFTASVRENTSGRQFDQVRQAALNDRQAGGSLPDPGRVAFEQSTCIWMRWPVEDVACSAAFHHLARVHHDHLVAQLCNHPEMV